MTRLGRIEIELGRPEAALTTLETVDGSTRDGVVRYLGRLFRGRALERLNRDNGMTIVMVTHDKAKADRSHRIVRLFDGRLVH